MILKKIIIFVTIFYSLNSETIYKKTGKEFRGIQDNPDLSLFHENVNLFLRDEYNRNWKDRANELGEYLVRLDTFPYPDPRMKCVESDMHYLPDISKDHLENLQQALSKSLSTYDIHIKFHKKNKKNTLRVDKKIYEIHIYINQILKFHISRSSEIIDLNAEAHLKLMCSDNPLQLRKFNISDNHETNLKQIFREEDGATGESYNKEMSDYVFEPRLESEENQKKKKKKRYQSKEEINEESESEQEKNYWRVSELNRDKERKKLSKKKDNPIVKVLKVIGLMKQKDKGVKVKKEGAYPEKIESDKRLKKSPIEQKKMVDEETQMKRDRGEENYYQESVDELSESLKLLNNVFQ